MTEAYPLQWPTHIPRSTTREAGQFKTTLAGALDNVETSLQRFGKDSGKPVSGIVLSSNVSLGRDKPADPGVAAWFTWEGTQVCIPVDRYRTPAANLQAIHHVLEARRTEIRHGTLALVRASLRGFLALPAPASASEPWWTVLEVGQDADAETIRAGHSRLARLCHPDRPGGSDAAMARLNTARDAALGSLPSARR